MQKDLQDSKKSVSLQPVSKETVFNRNEIELFDNTERDYNEVKKLEIKVCNYSEFEFFRVAKKKDCNFI